MLDICLSANRRRPGLVMRRCPASGNRIGTATWTEKRPFRRTGMPDAREVWLWDILLLTIAKIPPERRTNRNVWFAAPSPAVRES